MSCLNPYEYDSVPGANRSDFSRASQKPVADKPILIADYRSVEISLEAGRRKAALLGVSTHPFFSPLLRRARDWQIM
jgi:hypothetical protein